MNVFVAQEWSSKLVDDIRILAKEFARESGYLVNYDADKIYERVHTSFFDPDAGIITVETDDGDIMGAAFVYAIADWHVEKFGYLEKFFVRAEYRREGVGRVLAKKCSEWFDERECLFSFATSTANIGATRQFQNLMAKYGYEDIGPTLTRKLNHGEIQTT